MGAMATRTVWRNSAIRFRDHATRCCERQEGGCSKVRYSVTSNSVQSKAVSGTAPARISLAAKSAVHSQQVAVVITTGSTARKKAQASLRQNENVEPSVGMPTGKRARMAELSQRIGNILRRVSESLQPDNVSQIDRAELQECLLALEQMKMLISEVEIVHLLSE